MVDALAPVPQLAEGVLWAARPPKLWPLRTGAAVARNPSPLTLSL